MKKIVLAILSLALALVLLSGCDAAKKFEYEDNGDGTCTITGYDYGILERTISVPRELNGLTVTAIGNYAFSDFENLGTLKIPETVTGIPPNLGNGRFSRFNIAAIEVSEQNLAYSSEGGILFNKDKTVLVRVPPLMHRENYVIPSSVTMIGDLALDGCKGLTGSLTIPEGVMTIGRGAFQNCSGFTGNLVIPDTVTAIEGFAFAGCSGFTGSLVIPNGITEIGDHAFYGCNGLTGSLTIPESVTTIGKSAFAGCDGFAGNLTIENGVSEIGAFAFAGCGGFAGRLTIPESITTIGMSAFNGCKGLAEAVFLGDAFVSGYKPPPGPNPIPIISEIFFFCSDDLQVFFDPGKSGWDAAVQYGPPLYPLSEAGEPT